MVWLILKAFHFAENVSWLRFCCILSRSTFHNAKVCIKTQRLFINDKTGHLYEIEVSVFSYGEKKNQYSPYNMYHV